MSYAIRLATAVVALTFAAPVRDACAQSYRVQEIEWPPGAIAISLDDLNDHLQGVGRAFFFPSRGVGFLWDLAYGAQLLTFLEDPESLAINNFGVIAETRWLDRSSRRMAAFTFTGVHGAGYTEVALPVDSYATSLKLTDSGIVLLSIFSYSTNAYTSWAVYGNQLYNLSSHGAVWDVSDDATIAGIEMTFRPFVKRLDGSVRTPFAGRGYLGRMSINGYFAGGTCCDGLPISLVVGAPNSTVTRVPLTAQNLWVKEVTTSGDVLATIDRPGPMFDPVAVLYRDGQLRQVSELVNLPTRRFTHGVAITNTGVIAVAGGRHDSVFTNMGFVLFPAGPAPPAGLRFTVTSGTVSVTWEASTGALEYIVEAGSEPGLSDVFHGSVGAQRSISGPVPAGTYYVRVRAQPDRYQRSVERADYCRASVLRIVRPSRYECAFVIR